jgi:hypothetical protein
MIAPIITLLDAESTAAPIDVPTTNAARPPWPSSRAYYPQFGIPVKS